jgi:beta-N-acetylhexosaminidase
MTEAGSKWIDGLMGRLSLEQKVGQLMVFGFMGPVINPHVVDLITKYHAGGLRIAQKFHGGSSEYMATLAGKQPQHPTDKPDFNTYYRPADLNTKRVSCTPEEYAETLNTLRDMALSRKDGVSLHFAYDQEGEGADFLFQQRIFPYPMGLTASGDPELAYRVALASGLQARALGANMIHSPVLDVNTNPRNPEVGPRAYSDDPAVVAQYAIQSLRGYNEAGIITTGKHYPGRGESEQDAHFGLPVVKLDRATFMKQHIAPYQALIDAGLPAIMAAFTAYPCFGAQDIIPAATDPNIVSDLLRGELGFKGVVTTDNIQMNGLLQKYEMGEAVIRCLLAGCDLILCRSESPVTRHLIAKVIEAVKTKRYPEKMLDESVRRILTMRWNMGLAQNGGKVDASRAGQPFNDPFVTSVATEAAAKSVALLRDDQRILPLTRDTRVVLVEQIHHFHSFINTMYSHPGLLWEQLRKHSDNVAVVLINEKFSETDKAAVHQRLKEMDYDVIVTTSYYNYRSHATMTGLLAEMPQYRKPIVIVSNTPYEKFGVPAGFPTGIVCFAPNGRENLSAVADILYGKKAPTAKINVRLG